MVTKLPLIPVSIQGRIRDGNQSGAEKEANGNSKVKLKSAYVPSGPLGLHLFPFLKA